MVLDPIPQCLPVHIFGSRPQPPTSRLMLFLEFGLNIVPNFIRGWKADVLASESCDLQSPHSVCLSLSLSVSLTHIYISCDQSQDFEAKQRRKISWFLERRKFPSFDGVIKVISPKGGKLIWTHRNEGKSWDLCGNPEIYGGALLFMFCFEKSSSNVWEKNWLTKDSYGGFVWGFCFSKRAARKELFKCLRESLVD